MSSHEAITTHDNGIAGRIQMKPTDIVPFGKYKGQPIEVLRSDPGYCDYLTAQDFCKQKYPTVYQYIINHFGEPTETPEHNKLQVMFLDDTFCLRLLNILGWLPLDKNKLIIRAQQRIDDDRIKLEKCPDNDYSRRKELKEDIVSLEKSLTRYPNMNVSQITINREFECAGWDIKIEAKPPFWDSMIDSIICAVEVKPILGDDYPAILRQMKKHGQATTHGNKINYRVLVFDQFTATGATLEQVKEIFFASRFYVVSFAEIVRQELNCP